MLPLFVKEKKMEKHKFKVTLKTTDNPDGFTFNLYKLDELSGELELTFFSELAYTEDDITELKMEKI